MSLSVRPGLEIPDSDLEVAILDRTRFQARKFRRLTERQLADLLGDRGAATPSAANEQDAGATEASSSPDKDDPEDPTDTVSGDVPPLEDPKTGEPPVAPPVAPPDADDPLI